MKKLLTTMALFAALALTACGGNQPAEESSAAGKSSGKPASTSKHTHTADENAPYKWDDNNHWQECKDGDGGKVGTKAHTFEEDTTKADAATCEQAGKRYLKCSVCGYEKVEETGKLPHNWARTEKAATEIEGYAKTEQYKCSYGDHYALRFSAQEMDEALSLEACGLTAKDSSIYSEVNTSGSHAGSIRLRKAENDGGTEKLGTHAVYKVKLGAAATNVDLEFEIDPKDGFDVPVFDYVSNDSQQGYIKKADGTLELTTKRYGLRVNGVDVELGQDLHGDVNGGSHLWFNWNVKMNLQEGDNIIDVYCLGGYRAYIYNFQLAGLPANA